MKKERIELKRLNNKMAFGDEHNMSRDFVIRVV